MPQQHEVDERVTLLSRIRTEVEKDLLGCELRVGLFWAATTTYRRSGVCEPFPLEFIIRSSSSSSSSSSSVTEDSQPATTDSPAGGGGRRRPGVATKDFDSLVRTKTT